MWLVAVVGRCVVGCEHCEGFCSNITSHLLIRAVPALIRRCDDLPTTITHVPLAAVLVLNTPDDGRSRPKHVE